MFMKTGKADGDDSALVWWVTKVEQLLELISKCGSCRLVEWTCTKDVFNGFVAVTVAVGANAADVWVRDV